MHSDVMGVHKVATVGRTKKVRGLLLHSSPVNYNYSIFYWSKGLSLKCVQLELCYPWDNIIEK